MSRNTYGEALIVLAVIIGFFATPMHTNVSMENIWTSVILLVSIVVFYFALLFARMLFYWMTGGDHQPMRWHEHMKHWHEHEKHNPPKKK